MSYRVYSALSARVLHFKRHVLAPETRRNPWLRLACRLIGIALLAGMFGLGMLVYGFLLMVLAVQRLMAGKSPFDSSAEEDGQVLDGQCQRVDPTPEPKVMRKEF